MKTEQTVLGYSRELYVAQDKIENRYKIDNKYNLATKTAIRAIDIAASIAGIIILGLITVVVYVKSRINKDGPLFFSQNRIGKNGKSFRIYKFRTMVVGAEEILTKYLEENEEAREEYKTNKKLKNDPRITKIGKFLRKTSLDEFPQFINVLKGEMTLVGPRPYLPGEKEDMGECYDYIVEMKPGLTGQWQVSGRSNVTFAERLRIDMDYYYNRTFKEDIKIILKTACKIFKCNDAA